MGVPLVQWRVYKRLEKITVHSTEDHDQLQIMKIFIERKMFASCNQKEEEKLENKHILLSLVLKH